MHIRGKIRHDQYADADQIWEGDTLEPIELTPIFKEWVSYMNID